MKRHLKFTKLEKSWILYDVGNSAFTLLISTIIPIYFKSMTDAAGIAASDSTALWSYAASVCTVIVAILGPIFGTLADTKGFKKPLFVLFMMLGVLGCAAIAAPLGWIAFLLIFILAKVGFSGSLIFYNAMLSDVTTDDRMDMISSHGYAWGYLGSCIPFIGCLILVLTAELTGLGTMNALMLAFLITALWWFLVTIPLLKNYRQIHYIERPAHPVRESFRRIGSVIRGVRGQKKIFLFLVAFFFYIDGVYTIIDMATVYGRDVGIGETDLLLALLLTQIVAFPFAILFGRISKRFSCEKLVMVCIAGYFGIALFALQLDKAWEFWFLAVCVAIFQGTIQALSRSYYAKIVPKEKSSEYFGFFDIFGKGAAFLGTTVIGISTQLTGNSKTGIAILCLMFVIGFFFFRKSASITNSISNENSTVSNT